MLTNALFKLLRNIDRVQENLPDIIIDALLDNESELIDRNVEQLKQGLTKTGEKIEPEYASEEYGRLKKSLGSIAPLGTPDLILEGDFTAAWYVEKRGEGILFDSNDSKTPDLDEKYKNIFGLTQNNQDEAFDESAREIFKKITNEIFK